MIREGEVVAPATFASAADLVACDTKLGEHLLVGAVPALRAADGAGAPGLSDTNVRANLLDLEHRLARFRPVLLRAHVPTPRDRRPLLQELLVDLRVGLLQALDIERLLRANLARQDPLAAYADCLVLTHELHQLRFELLLLGACCF